MKNAFCIKVALATLIILAVSHVSSIAQIFQSGDLAYQINGNTAGVVALMNENATDVVIPPQVAFQGKSYPITCIDVQAFKSTPIKSVAFGDNIVRVADHAFSTCESLTKVVMNDALKEIEENAFEQCPLLNDVTWSQGIERIAGLAFYNCFLLDKTITFGAALKDFSSSAFRGCNNIPAYSVDAANPNFKTEEGILFSKDGTRLVIYPTGKRDSSFSTPANLKEVGDNAFRGCSNLRTITLNEGLEKIGSFAFASDYITSMTIPASVTSIGDAPFLLCFDFNDLQIAEGNTNFEINSYYLYDKIRNRILQIVKTLPRGVNIPAGTESIGQYTFYHQEMSRLILPSSLKQVDMCAFVGCDKLTEVICREGLEEIGRMAFQECGALKTFKFPLTLRKIGKQAFCFDEMLAEANLPDALDYLDMSAFLGCSRLKKASIPGNLSYFGSSVFYGCPELTDCQIAEGLTAIPEQTFNFCYKLANVNIPSTVESIGRSAFYGTAIRQIEFPQALKRIDYLAFSSSQLQRVVIPDGVEEIAAHAFSWCSLLESFTFGKSVKVLRDHVLHKEDNLSEVIIPEGAEVLEDYAISFAPKITSLTLPSTVSSIGESSLCSLSLSELTVLNPEPPTVSEYALSDAEDRNVYEVCTLKVPEESISEYSNAEVWKDFIHITAEDSGVETVSPDEPIVKEIYTLDGLSVDKPVAGTVNILRMSDGSIRKVLFPKR